MKNKKKHMSFSRRANRTVLFRTFVLMALCGVIMFVPLMVQLYQIQVVDHDKYQQMAVEQQTRDTVISPKRGSILDRNYKQLAVSASVETVFISPVSIKDQAEAELIARGLSGILSVDYDALYAKTQKAGRYYEIVRKKIERDLGDQVRALIKENKLEQAVYIVPDYKRYYPNGNFLSHVLGFVGDDNQGLDGIEKVYDSDLKGAPGRIVTLKDGTGRTMPQQNEQIYDAQDGLNAVLTIDATIQSFLSKNLKNAIVENQVQQRAAAICMDVRTGEILGMDTEWGYDPNQPREITDADSLALIESLTGDERNDAIKNALYAQWRNKTVVDTYEPGSTFKIITAAMALEEKVVSEEDQFHCSGSVMVPGWGKPINCHRRDGHGAETFRQGVMNSCNPVFISSAQRVGTEKFYQYFKAFGFTEKTGIDVPGESGSVFASWKNFDNQVTLSVYSFGQTFNITPIQLITATAAVANGGHLMKPHLVREFTDADNNVVKTVEPEVVRDVISPETSRRVMAILEDVVKSGTGKNAYVAGYRIAGKTGTSQKRDPNNPSQYAQGKYVVSFMALAPADDPQIALLVLLDEPMAGPPNLRSGGNMAAPLAGRMLADIMPYLNIEPKYTDAELKNVEITVPPLSGLPLADAEKLLGAQNLKYRIMGEGDTVTQQVPATGARVPGTAEIVLYLGEKVELPTVTVPDLSGMSKSKANSELNKIGLYMRASGATAADAEVKVYEQDIPPETEVPVGSVVSVEFRDMSLPD